MSRLDHVHIIRHYESFLQDNMLCIVMEHAGGGDLGQVIKSRWRASTSVPLPPHAEHAAAADFFACSTKPGQYEYDAPDEEQLWTYLLQMAQVRVRKARWGRRFTDALPRVPGPALPARRAAQTRAAPRH